MNIKEFAKNLNGRQYKYPQFTKEEIQIAKDNGFVIVYGASDDLMEFDGAIYAEAGCYLGGKVYFDKKGKIIEDGEFPNCRCIEALWCEGESEATWSYKTDIPHETFMIYEDEEPYCEAIVFNIENMNQDTNSL